MWYRMRYRFSTPNMPDFTVLAWRVWLRSGPQLLLRLT